MAEGRSTAPDGRQDTHRTGQPREASDGGSLTALADRPAERHRAVAAGFTERVLGTKDWDAPTPVPQWTARDVVRHLCEWFPSFLADGTGIELARGPSVDVDPAAAWQVHADAVQALLDDPATADRKLRHPMVGEHPLAPAIDQFYTVDIFMHTWDLARATGQDDSLDPDLCATLLAGMEPIEGLLRDSGQYGPRVEVPAGSDPRTRLVAFIGRDPSFSPQA
ncbi:TIGR03086 family metal-binding protein [Pseudofrankia inefficax]|uniref:Mycothiol-dependent maleylpyruvate isomerase metal-binding domain-containing protein n=1 Tax=Pseudofrankia inefficax (strain DSM 45817 / CECT 9037 / DDB 130130 / EuI1c) TaxID=298654 RepID=E3J1H4_PSEI1|nr:TIGR03086 family metal-binding protein [Pseudofrankia inefficax]ADP81642.1 hypothetical protein FraEuI1c_3635 [Pseudofrankia inefficax]